MKYIFFVLIALFVISCTQADKVSLMSKKYCTLERMEFQEITDTTIINQDGEKIAGIAANGKVIISDKINVDSLGAQIKAGNKVFINQKTYRTVKVSESFYEKFTSNRNSLCQLIEGVKSGIISSKTGKEKAEDLYLEMVRAFADIQSLEEKKN